MSSKFDNAVSKTVCESKFIYFEGQEGKPRPYLEVVTKVTKTKVKNTVNMLQHS
jgi:hypothetical protein